jgi:hypothetical protein
VLTGGEIRTVLLIPPVRIMAVVLPALIASCTSSQVISSIQTVSRAAIARGRFGSFNGL